MVLNVVMMVSVYPVLLILYFILANEVEPKKNIVIGVTLPYSARINNSVEQTCKEYKKWLKVVVFILAPIPIVTFLIDSISINMTIYMLWMDAVIILPYIVYGVYNTRLRSLKKKNGWGVDFSLDADTTVDTKVAAMTFKKLNAWWFAPPLALSLIPLFTTIIADRSKEEYWSWLILYGTNVLLIACFILFHSIIYRQRAEIVDGDSNLTMALTRVRRYNWSKCWIIIAWLTGVYSFFAWVFIESVLGILATTVIYTVLLLYFVIRVEFTTRAVQQKLSKESGKEYYLDDDDHWILGMFYYNEYDKHIIINDRVGIGTTVNFARITGKLVMAFSAICILSMPLVGVWMMKEEFTPITTYATEAKLIVTHTSTLLDLDLSEITSVELLQELPRASKISGTNFDTLLKGKFRVTDIGVCWLYLNPKRGPYIKLNTDNRCIIIGTEEKEKTLELYDQLILNRN